MKPEGKRLNQARLAKALGVSEATISKDKNRGMPVSSPAAASAWRREHLDPAHMNPAPGEAAPARHHLRRPASTIPTGGGARAARTSLSTFQQARTAREVYEAKLAQLRYEQESGALINAAKVHAEFAKQVVVVRDRLLQLSDRLTVVVMGETDSRRVRALIDTEVRAALAEFHSQEDEKPIR